MENSIGKSRSKSWLCSLLMLIVIPRPSHRTVLGKVILKYNVGKSVAPREIRILKLYMIMSRIRVKRMRARCKVLNKYEQLKLTDKSS